MIAVVGGGPSGLRAAEVAASCGHQVTLFEGRRSVGRKFLVAGKGGLNLTHEEPADEFCRRYLGEDVPAGWWLQALSDFGPAALRDWADGLGAETFVASSGRVYPRSLQSAVLLRAWIARLRRLGVHFLVHHRLLSLQRNERWAVNCEVDGQVVSQPADAVILALGGGSWPSTGSDAAWVPILEKMGIKTSPLAPANCGWEVAWSLELLAQAEGLPLKNIVVRVGETAVAGELLLTRYGLEGGALYQLASYLRQQVEPTLEVDLKPTQTEEQLAAKLTGHPDRLWKTARQKWRLSPAAGALLLEQGAARLSTPRALAQLAKHCRISLRGPRPLAEAISSAGGVCWSELTDGLMVRRHPGLFVAGEMIDWEAPTGGYLLQGAFSTGQRAGRSAVEYLRSG